MFNILARRARLVLGSRRYVGESILEEALFFVRHVSVRIILSELICQLSAVVTSARASGRIR